MSDFFIAFLAGLMVSKLVSDHCEGRNDLEFLSVMGICMTWYMFMFFVTLKVLS